MINENKNDPTMRNTKELEANSLQPYSKPVPPEALGLQNATGKKALPLSRRLYLLARLVAEGDLSDEKISAQVGMSRTAMSRWKRKEEFQAIVEAYRRHIERDVFSTGIALKSVRIAKLTKHAQRIESIFNERSAAHKNDTPGGESGLLAHDVKSVGSGPNAEVVDIYQSDSALAREYRDTIAQIAKEVGGHFDAGAVGPGTTNVNVPVQVPVIICFGDGVNEIPE